MAGKKPTMHAAGRPGPGMEIEAAARECLRCELTRGSSGLSHAGGPTNCSLQPSRLAHASSIHRVRRATLLDVGH
jgi:hypothetical protein